MASTVTDRTSGLGTSAVPNGDDATISLKVPVKVATTANITLSGAQTIDGVSVVANDRVLVKDQTDGTENGIYIAATGDWSRARDCADTGDLVEGTEVRVNQGSTNQGRFYCASTDPVTIGTDTITWTQVTGLEQTDGDKGDITVSSSGTVMTIDAGAVTNAKLASQAQATIKGRASGAGTGQVTDLNATQATAILNAFVGDSGAGGTKGLVPAPAAGDAAAGKYLDSDGNWTTPPNVDFAWDTLGSGSLSSSSSGSVTGIANNYTEIMIAAEGMAPSAVATMNVEYGDSGGFDTSGYTPTGANGWGVSGSTDLDIILRLVRASGTNFWYTTAHYIYTGGSIGISLWFKSTSNPLDRVRLRLTAGVFNAGAFVVLGRR